MAKSKPKNAWITIQSHVNIVAVALMVEQSCIIVSEGVEVEKEAVERQMKKVCHSKFFWNFLRSSHKTVSSAF